MRRDVFESCDWNNFKFEDKNYLACLVDEFEKFEMKQALRKAVIKKPSDAPDCLIVDAKKSKFTFEPMTLDTKEKLDSVISKLNKDTLVAFDTETTSLDTKEANLVGFSFCIDETKAYYVPVGHCYLGAHEQVGLSDALSAIKKIFSCKLVGQNLKYDLSLLYNRYSIERIHPHGDTMILAWLSNPAKRVGLDHLAKEYFDYDMKSFSDTVKKGENFSSVSIEDATFYAGEDAWMTYLLFGAINKKLELASLEHLKTVAKNVEYPFINVLAKMEKVGIGVDLKKLNAIKVDLSSKIGLLTKEIYEQSGSEFNIRSTQQLGVILFQNLGLKGCKKTKTGYSTNEAVLESLRGEHPIIEKLL